MSLLSTEDKGSGEYIMQERSLFEIFLIRGKYLTVIYLCAHRLVWFPNGREVVCDPPVDLPVDYDEGQDRREEEIKSSQGRERPQDAEWEAAEAPHRHRDFVSKMWLLYLRWSVAEMG